MCYDIAQDGTYVTPIDHVFARFLLRILNKVDLKVLQEVAVILSVWRNSINNTYSKFEENKYLCYSRDATSARMLEIVNELVLNYIDEQEKYYEKVLTGGKLLLATKRPFHLAKFIYFFSRWLFAEKYTNSKLQINNYDAENATV
jgi:hypothetical protein